MDKNQDEKSGSQQPGELLTLPTEARGEANQRSERDQPFGQ